MRRPSQPCQPAEFLSALTEFDSTLTIPYDNQLEQLYVQVPQILEQLAQNYHLGLIANQANGLKDRLTSWQIAKYFDEVISSAESGCAKPDLRIFEMALSQANCQPHQAVMIGDRLDNDIFPAKKLGMKTIWIRQGFGAYQESKNSHYQPDVTISELSKILSALTVFEK